MPDANTPTPPAPDPVEQAKERELRLAKLEAQIAEQRKQALLSSLPTTETKPLEGTTTVDNKVSVEGESLVYESIGELADRIVHALTPVGGGPVVLTHDAENGRALAAFRAFDAQVESFVGGYDALAPRVDAPDALADPGTALAMAAVGTTARTVVDLLALFRTNTEITDKEFTIADSSLAAAVGGRLARGNAIVYYPDLHPIESGRDASAASHAWAALARARAHGRNAAAHLGAAGGRPDLLTRLTALDDSVRALEQALVVVDPQTRTSPLTTITRGAALAGLLGGTGRLVWLKMLRAAGATRVTRNLIRSRVSYGGTAIVAYMVFGPDGRICTADTLSKRSGFRSLED